MSDGAIPYALSRDATMLRVRVTPRAAQTSAGGVWRDAEGRTALVVRVTVAPEKGKANKAVIAALAKSLKLAKSRFTITSGAADRNKTVAIDGDPAEFEPALRGLITSDAED